GRPAVRLLGRQPAQVGVRAARHRRPRRPRSAARRAVPADRLVGRHRALSRPLRPPGHRRRHELPGGTRGARVRRAHLGLGAGPPLHGRARRLRRAGHRGRGRRAHRRAGARRRGHAGARHAAGAVALGPRRQPGGGGPAARPGRGRARRRGGVHQLRRHRLPAAVRARLQHRRRVRAVRQGVRPRPRRMGTRGRSTCGEGQLTRRTTAALALGAAAAMLLPACSAFSGGDSGTVTLTMVESLTNPSRTQLLERLIDDFEGQHPNIDVNLVSPPTEQADQKLQQMLMSGSGIDVLEVRDITVGPFSTNGWLHNMKADLEGWDGWQAMTENAVQAAHDSEDRVFYVPYGFYGLSLFYRTDLIAQAGFSAPPATWEELLQQASAIHDPAQRRYGYAFRGGARGSSNVTAAISAYVADEIDVDNGFRLRDGRTIFAAPAAQQAVETYFALFRQASAESSISWGYPE